MSILFLTDSLGYPRVDSYETLASDVWTYKVRGFYSKQGLDSDFYFDMKPLRSSKTLITDIKNHILSYKPELIIMQIGIVDCYPRALKHHELQIISRVPILSYVVKRLINRYYSFIVKKRDIAYVDKKDFKSNLLKIKKSFPLATWLVLPIAPANLEYSKKNPLIKSRVTDYNHILASVFGDSLLNNAYFDADLSRFFLNDNHHLSKYGHNYLANRVYKELIKINDQKVKASE